MGAFLALLGGPAWSVLGGVEAWVSVEDESVDGQADPGTDRYVSVGAEDPFVTADAGALLAAFSGLVDWELGESDSTIIHLQPLALPSLRAFPDKNFVDGERWPAHQAVHVEVNDPATEQPVDFTADPVARGDGHVQTFLVGYDLGPGDVITMASGELVVIHIVKNLFVTGTDLERQTVAGTVDGPEVVHVFSGPAELRVNSDRNGNWIADFSGLSEPVLSPGVCGNAEAWGQDGSTIVEWCLPPAPPSPWLTAFPGSDAVEAVEWPDGAAVRLTIDDPDTPGSPDHVQAGVMHVPTGPDTRPVFGFEFASAYDLRPGDVVTVSDGSTARSLVVENLMVTAVESSDDTVAGTAVAGTLVQVWPHGWVGTVLAIADENGSWVADFSGLFDIAPGIGGRSQIPDGHGNATAVDWEAPPLFTTGTLTITSDTALALDHHGDIAVAADGVTLDCAGHRIVGAGQQAGIAVRDRIGVRVRNCQARGFLAGFVIAGSSQIWLEGNVASENENGYDIGLSDHVRAGNNTASSNLIHGFGLTDSNDNTLSHNRSFSNGGSGFFLANSDGNFLTDNVAEDNMASGFFAAASDGNWVEDTISRRNTDGFGIDDSSGNVLEANQASDNRGHGFRLTRVRLGRLAQNTASGNAVHGFHVERSLDVALSDNVAQLNGHYDVVVLGSSNIEFQEVATPVGAGDGGGLQRRYLLELLSFLGLASSIWLGLYLIGQPRRTPIAWLTALTLWSVAGIFLDDFMGFNQPAKGFVQQIQEVFGFWPGANEIISQVVVLGWVSKFAIVFWYHATTLMRPAGMTRVRKGLLVLGYGLAGAAALIQIASPERLTGTTTLYPLFAASLVAFASLCLLNLVEAVRGARSEIERRQFVLLVAATLIAGLSGLVFVAAEWITPPLPAATGTALLWLAVLLLGYGVANYSAIVEGRTIRRHFIYSLAAVSLITFLYFIVSYLSSLSFGVRTAAFAFVILLAVVTHSLAGNARAILDYFFVDPETRKVLRAFRLMPNNLSQEGRLEERLGLALDNLCTEIRASYGLVLLISDQRVRLAASYHWKGSVDLPLQAEALASDDILPLRPGTLPRPLDGAVLLAPLYLEAEHVGGVLLGHPVNGTRYDPAEVDLAGYASDRIAEIIRMKRLEDEAVAHLSQVAVLPPPAMAEGEPSLGSVEEAMRRMHDLPYLGGSPLAELRAVRARLPAGSPTTVDRGRAVHQVLVEAIEKLKPEGQRPAHSSPREWHHYMVLHEAYLMDRANRDVMADLYISEGTFNRRRREAIEAVTRFLHEQEEGGGAGTAA